MTNNYSAQKKELDRIRSEYGCKGDILFRTAIQCLIEYGTNSLLEDLSYEHLKNEINKRHNDAEAEGRILWITRDFELAILECAREIAEHADIYNLLIYIQKEVWLSHEGGIDYETAVKLLKNCMSWIEEDHASLGEMLDTLEYIGFNDDDIEALGFAYILDVREEEEDA